MTREQQLEEAVKLVIASLKSHLPYTYGKSKEGKKFHQKCVAEYARLLSILSKLY